MVRVVVELSNSARVHHHLPVAVVLNLLLERVILESNQNPVVVDLLDQHDVLVHNT